MTFHEYLFEEVKLEVVPLVDMKKLSGKNRMFLPSSLHRDKGFGLAKCFISGF